MERDIQFKIDDMESSVRCQLSYMHDARHATVLVHAQDLLDIFAAFRLEIIKAGGRNA